MKNLKTFFRLRTDFDVGIQFKSTNYPMLKLNKVSDILKMLSHPNRPRTWHAAALVRQAPTGYACPKLRFISCSSLTGKDIRENHHAGQLC